MDKKIKSIYIGCEDAYENSDANMFSIDIKDVFDVAVIEPYEVIELKKNELSLSSTKYCKYLRLILRKSADRVLCKDKDKEITLFDRLFNHNDLFSIDFYGENNEYIDGFLIPWDSMYNKTNNSFQKSKKHISLLEIIVKQQDISEQEWLDDYYFMKKYFK